MPGINLKICRLLKMSHKCRVFLFEQNTSYGGEGLDLGFIYAVSRELATAYASLYHMMRHDLLYDSYAPLNVCITQAGYLAAHL